MTDMPSALQDRLQAALGDAYRVEQELARGGMSHLFLATEISLNRRIVVKVLPPEMASEVSAARFRQEIEVAAHLQHPHILPVLSTGARGDLLYFTMPYVEGESLRHRLTRDGPLAVPDAVRILREVADALAFAHERGVVHRDIKPENILLQQGHAVLADFGVARAVEEARAGSETRLTAAGAAVGTPGYMSPEQAAGEPHIDARADIYALAVVGYEMLSGEPPFAGPTLQAILTAHLTETPKPIHELRPDVPISVSAAIDRALEKNPAERFQSAAQLRDALFGADTPATPTMPVPVIRARRRRRAAAWSAAALVVLGVSGALALWPRGYRVEGDPRKSVIVFPFENQTGRGELAYLEEASMNLLGLSLGHWEDLRLYDDERTASLMRRRDVASARTLDFETARAMAREARVGTLVLGDIRREGELMAVEAKVHDVTTGERIGTEVARTRLDADPRPVFDSLAARILRISGAPAGARPGVVAQTTHSLEAYRAYLAGTEALQRFETDSARMQLERAIALDSAFALAYVQLRNVGGWSGGEGAVQRSLIAKAEAHSEQLPPRLRALVQFHAAYEDGHFRRARTIIEELLAKDSTDVEAWYQLGEAHWHHNSGQFPRPTPDTLGKLGVALRAFQRVLALDANYLIAYQHLIDVQGNCATFTFAVCLGDSAVYGTPEELAERFGAARIERLRAEAAAARIRAAYDWVAASPRSSRTRQQLIAVLVNDDRHDEALTQARVLQSQGFQPVGLAWEAVALYHGRRFREAANRMSRAVVLAPDSAALTDGLQAPVFNTVAEVLGAGGRVTEAVGAGSLRLIGFPGDSIGGASGSLGLMPKSFYAEYERFLTEAHYGLDSVALHALSRDWLATLRSAMGQDTARFRAAVSNGSWAFLAAYLVSRDTVPIVTLELAQDSTSTASWRVVRALLALERGDTAEARRRIARDWRNPQPAEYQGIFGVARAALWADLLARLGRYADAMRTYETLDTISAMRGGLLIRSWAELANLYQRAGDTERAAEMFRRVADAWRDGDPAYREFAQRAEAALQHLNAPASRPRT